MTATKPGTRLRSVILVFCCTVFGAAAQVLMKIGAGALSHFDPQLWLTNVPLMAGLTLYGISTVLLVLALREGELSLLYPVIALTYVWVTILSVAIFHETLNVFKAAGVAAILAGVTILGRSSSK